MSDSNLTRVCIKERFDANRRSFENIFGNPFAKPESIHGHYQILKRRSHIHAVSNNFDEGRSTSNVARPNVIDFLCDVERVVRTVLKDTAAIQKFCDTYIHETPTHAYTTEDRCKLEQSIGRLLRARHISPASRYFTTVRRTRCTPGSLPGSQK